MHLKHLTGAVIAAAVTLSAAMADTLPRLTVAALEYGTVNWELDTIRHEGFDRANGFTLEVMPVAGGPAGRIAFQGGKADVFVSDWLWVARQRAAGKDYAFIPYSTAVGGVMVPADSTAETLADLTGGKIGIAGGPLDKSWLILRAYAAQEHGIDLAEATEQVFGAPPLIYKTALQGQTEGAINFWHFMAKMEADGMRKLIDTATAARALGLDPATPLLGYIVRGETLAEAPALVHGLMAASRQTKALLADDEAAWERLRPMMRAENDAQFEALKAGFRAGIPAPGPVDEAAADRMLRLMASLGGAELLGRAETLPVGVFVRPDS